MKVKILSFLLVLCTLKLSSQEIPEISQRDIDGKLWFVQIYKENCRSCAEQRKQMEKVGQIFEGIIRVGKVSFDAIPNLKKASIKADRIYGLVKGSVMDYVQYHQKISRISIAKFLLSEIQSTVKQRDKTLFQGQKHQSNAKPKGNKGSSKPKSDVIQLNDKNFQQKVLKSQQAWFVEFYSPSCGHCHALQPQWDKLPAAIGKKVNIAKIDATKNRQMAQKYQIQGFPTLLLFPLNNKQKPEQYSGERTADAMVSWLNTQKIGQERRQFLKLTKQLYDQQCNRNIVCLIFVLEAKSELKKLSFVEDILEEQKKKPLRFFYSSRLLPFEQEIMIEDRATPKMISIWDSINSYKVFNGVMEKQNVDEFITKIMQRRSWIKRSEKLVDLLFKKNQNDQL